MKTAAAISPAPLFTDHAVLQRDHPVPVWGRAAAGEKVLVSFRGQKTETAADSTGRWCVTLAPMSASNEGRDLVIAGTNTITLRDVVIGEVWLCSGQSNMEWPLNLARDAVKEVAAANNPLIRHLKVERSPSDNSTDTFPTSGWHRATPEVAGSFTAVGWFFAQALQQKLGVPVGIINSSWGGTPIESWLPEPVLRTGNAWPRFEAEWRDAVKVFPQKLAEYPALDAAWQKANEESRRTGQPNPLPWPHPPVGPGTAYAPGGLFNGMIAPLAPFALRGALWYQGESNVGRATEYAELLPAMIKAWRAQWAQGDFAFLVVQLPNYADNNPAGRARAELREAQTSALALPNTGLAVTIDLGDSNDIHPTNKRPVGERLALIAANKTYGVPDESSGPQFAGAVREGAVFRIKFTHAAGLISRAAAITGFEIAGADKFFHSAVVRLDGETVLVSSPDVPEPVAVRHAWTNSPTVTLFNAAGLPAAPFRTDSW